MLYIKWNNSLWLACVFIHLTHDLNVKLVFMVNECMYVCIIVYIYMKIGAKLQENVFFSLINSCFIGMNTLLIDRANIELIC